MPKPKKTIDYEVIKEGQEEIMQINAITWPTIASIENSSQVMALTIDKLMEVPSVSRIVFLQKRNYEYDYEQTHLLHEIASLYNFLVKQKKLLALATQGPSFACTQCQPTRQEDMERILLDLLKSDPLGAYVEVKRLLRQEKRLLAKEINSEFMECREDYVKILNYLINLLGNLQIVKKVKHDLEGFVVGNRDLYKKIFKPSISPNFIFTRLLADLPTEGKVIDSYVIDNNEITIIELPMQVKLLYHVNPPEFRISDEKYKLVELARNVLSEHKPQAEEFIDPERMRRTFFNIGKDLIQDLAENEGLTIEYSEVIDLANIIVKYTVGFGLLENLLADEKIQDIVINSPIGQTPIFVVHQDYGECVTNIYPSSEDGESWATKFRLLSGRPLDEAHPVLDTELVLPKARARVSAMTSPINPLGLGYAIRRHRDSPWTYPLFIKNRMMNPLAAGLLSFLIDGARTILFAGTRSSGKTSLLDATLLEILRKYRIITIEDTLELSTNKLREYGYNVQPLKVRAALTESGTEVSADEGIRTSLRMGDSCLIVGEVRSVEARALYEAMRIGSLANLVAGTIHGASPYSVFDRVVNDLGVPATSFKATDIIVICNPVTSPGSMQKIKRVISINEVRKDWVHDPQKEQGFAELMRYDIKTDSLIPTDYFINGESEVLKSVASRVKQWAGDWNLLWDNILLRAKVKEIMVNYAVNKKKPALLEAYHVVVANDIFHVISEKVNDETGYLDSKKILNLWTKWLYDYAKKIS